MGLVVMVVMGVYLAVSAIVLSWAINHAKKNGKSVKKWGWGAVLVMYLIPCWDWLPTVATHQYYCTKDSGFWVYKTLDQWKTENPGVMKGLTTQRVWPRQHVGDMKNYTSTAIVNQRFNYVNKKSGPFLFNVWQHDQEIFDSKTSTVLARQIDFSTGNGNVGGEPELRFWIHSDDCFGGRDNAIAFVKYFNQFKGTEK
jgi:hypothetical protein